MRLSLTFHDVVAAEDVESSGFPGAAAAHYKLTPERFCSHLDAIGTVGLRPSLVTDEQRTGSLALHLTFDDGGRSALEPIAPILAERGWSAHFFVTTSELGRSGFLRRDQLALLRDLGHLVGSHAHTHRPLTRLRPADVLEELSRSKAFLEDELHEPVVCLSAPGGFCSRRVAEQAEAAGYRHLFDSEPTLGARKLGALSLHGRFALVSGTRPAQTAALCRLSFAVRARKRAGWIARRSARSTLGPLYARPRVALLRRRAEMR
jgi:peptidoglycan/xylan/chitin deacetylase (PgdA/CDA1 family)